MATYELYPEAERDLEAIWEYSVKRWGVPQALNYLDELDRAFSLLASSPLITRERTEFRPPVRIFSHAHHLIVYLVRGARIDIVRVLHESMDVGSKLE